MIVRGFIRTADLEEAPAGSDRLQLVLSVQGVGPGQPRRIVVPHDLLVADPALDPDTVVGRSFAAEVERDDATGWVVGQITVAARVLRHPEG